MNSNYRPGGPRGGTRRRSERHRVFLRAQLSYFSSDDATPCVVNQISDDGARLELGHLVVVPENLQIRISQRDLHCPARLVWLNDGQAAVEFQKLGPNDLTTLQMYKARSDRLEAMAVALRAQLADIAERLRNERNCV